MISCADLSRYDGRVVRVQGLVATGLTIYTVEGRPIQFVTLQDALGLAEVGTHHLRPADLRVHVLQQLGQAAQNSLQAGMNIPPTISIRPGFRLNIELTTDVILPGAYQP